MKKVITVLSVATMLFTSSVYADVKVITSKIIGDGYAIDKTVNIRDPFFEVGNLRYELNADAATAKEACKLLEMDYLIHSTSLVMHYSPGTVELSPQGALRILGNVNKIGMLSCQKRD